MAYPEGFYPTDSDIFKPHSSNKICFIYYFKQIGQRISLNSNFLHDYIARSLKTGNDFEIPSGPFILLLSKVVEDIPLGAESRESQEQGSELRGLRSRK